MPNGKSRLKRANTTTIAALATAPAPAGLAVVRVSGPQARVALRALFKSKRSPVDSPREMIFGDLLDFETKLVIDRALAVYMPMPHSFTGEDVAEFQFHGSPLLVEKLLRSLFAFGAVPAEPGEFTKRAFLNGKLDLVQAEAIGELISATSEQALKIASEHLGGRFSGVIQSLADPIRDALAEVEAAIDFPDEDISPAGRAQLSEKARKAEIEILNLLDTYSFGQVVREGYRVLICGRPNAGKSSLLNLLLGRPRAIVTDVSGTTRDLIEEQSLIDGYRFVFCDSAGIRETGDKVEQIGIGLAIDKIDWADLVLLVIDAADTGDSWKELLAILRSKAKKIWMITNKIDLNPNAFTSFYCDSAVCSQNFYLSARTKAGFASLTEALVDEVRLNVAHSAESTQVVTNERQRSCLMRASDKMKSALVALSDGAPLEIVSIELRAALAHLDEIIGRTYNEDILGRIFSKFCIGK